MASPATGHIVLFRGLPPTATVAAVFNIACLYGNVQKVRLLPNKPGMAFVAMDDPAAASMLASLI
ncbi:MAG: hypothetical protein ACK55I_50710 [bacterium]